MEFIHGAEIELADIQNTEEFLEEIIKFFKENHPDDRYEISRLEDALIVLWDLESDLT